MCLLSIATMLDMSQSYRMVGVHPFENLRSAMGCPWRVGHLHLAGHALLHHQEDWFQI